MPRRVLVIGAGCSGLVAIKECHAEGLDVVCLEALPWIGGLWHFTESESHSSVFKYTAAPRAAAPKASWSSRLTSRRASPRRRAPHGGRGHTDRR